MLLALALHCAVSTAPAAANVLPSDVYLRADYSIWAGVHLTQKGQNVGPGIWATRLKDAVRDVPVAELHAEHAQIASVVAWTFGVASLSLALGSLGYHFGHPGNSWPLLGEGDAVQMGLNIGWLVSLAGGIAARRVYHNELLVSVTEYNYALMRSVESQFE